MGTAKQVQCAGCLGVIVAPGPRIVYTGMPGQYHVSCATAAAVHWEREACANVADMFGRQDFSDSYLEACRDIASAIRNRHIE